ncbi:MAG: UDP-N-acetylmuramoyl-L-alanyl-D-glutamate--2,6-diaminopimelate ligase [Brevinematia bacterium]
MKLSKILTPIEKHIISKKIVEDIEIESLSEDSRDHFINENTLFFAREGTKVDATKFIPQVVDKGCKTFITTKNVAYNNLNIITVDNITKVEAIVAKNFFNKPDEKLKVIGVTGTKGKTTISYMIFNALYGIGMRGGLIGTIEYRLNESSIQADNTTPGPLQLYTFLNDIVQNHGEFVSMEVSSHGLETNRVYGIKFDVGIFTNLSREHLDFHKTMENYFNSKMKLLYQMRELNPKSKLIINIDTEWGQKAYEIAKKIGLETITCSLKEKADIFAKNITVSLDGNEFIVEYKGKQYKFYTKMVGIHNIYNAICALGAISQIIPDKIENAIDHISKTTVKGRFQILKSNRGFFVVIDYAHTPDSLEKTLETGRLFFPKRLTVVFGAGGDRDKGKRPLMGEVASRIADKVIITNDNPRTEYPPSIISDILSGIPEERIKKVKIIEDRKRAINTAIKEAIEGEIIIIAGKGHEEYQIIGEEKIPFSDIEEVIRSEYF